MSDITVIGLNGEAQEVSFEPGDSLMEVLRDAGYEEIIAMCGGCCSCATCHVHIENQADFELPPIEEDEELLVSMADNYQADASRLSCQLTLNDEQTGLRVQIIETD